jgi:hypothetical protein
MKLLQRILFALTISILLFSALASAQSPKKVLKQAEKALGGKLAYLRLRSTVHTGRITRVSDGATGKYLQLTARPDVINTEFDLAGFEVESGYNGRSSWMRNSRDGLKTATGDESLMLQAEAEFRNELWFNAKTQKAKLVGDATTKIGDRSVNVVKMITAKGILIRMYFDAVTGFMLRDEISVNNLSITTDHENYLDVSGTKQAYFRRIASPESALEITFDKIETGKQLAASDFDFPITTGAPLPDIRALLVELQANEERVEALLDNYSYTQKSIKRELRKDGVLRETGSETNQLSFYKGYRISRLIERNGKPLTVREQAEEDKSTAKRIEEIERNLSKKTASGPPSEDGRRISIAEVLRASKLLNPRRERFRGRSVIVFDFEPDPNFDFNNAKSMLKFFGKTAGVMWIDEQDKQVARLEATLADSYKVGGGLIAKLKKGASFTLEQERIGDEIWLPSQADINLSVRVLLVKGIEINQILRSYDYQRFETEVKDARINELPQQ